VLLRSSFGILGSNVPCLIRALVACGWFGIQTMFGGLAIHLFLGSVFDGWKSLGGTGEVIGFMIFWALNLWVVMRGAESIKWLETLSAPLLVAVGIGLVWAMPNVSMTELLAIPPSARKARAWSVTSRRADRDGRLLGHVVAEHSRLQPLRQKPEGPDPRADLRPAADHVPVRLAGRGDDRRVGETGGRDGVRPGQLIGHIQSPVWVAVAMALIIIATLSTNTAANIVSPTNDFQNIAPR
jgi:NCS1 family nucleobase:cation symporter-1